MKMQKDDEKKERDALESEGVSYIQAQAEKNPAAAQSVIFEARDNQSAGSSQSENPGSSDDDMTGENTVASGGGETLELPETTADPVEEKRERLLADWQNQISTGNIILLTNEQKADYLNRFADCIVIGDSMAQAVLEYGFLDSTHVIYRRGFAIGQLGTAVEDTAALLPSKVIFFTGLNDTDYYAEPLEYAKAYSDQIAYLRSLIPGVKVYVCSMLPPSNALGAVRPDLARSDLYDASLKVMCETQDIIYIDTKWMVNQSLYKQDGIHFISGFYDIWLQYVALMMDI